MEEIHHTPPAGATLSRFAYLYDPVGNITTWTQQHEATTRAYDFTYDAADQLTGAVYRTADPTPTVLKRYGYVYDPVGNRTTEQIDDAPRTWSHDTMNRITAQAGGGVVAFAGTVSEPAVVTIQSRPARVDGSQAFVGSAVVGTGTNVVEVTATDASGNASTASYEVDVDAASDSFTYDANGNLTADGTRTFEWDAVNRLVAVNIGTHRSEFTYDGASQRTRIVEKENGARVRDAQVFWDDAQIIEERLSTGEVNRFFDDGESHNGVAGYLTRDHLGSIREVTDAAGAVVTRNDYDPYGRLTRVAGNEDSRFGYTGHMAHAPSGLVLALYRAYDAALGWWLSEDPEGFIDGPMMFAYVLNGPVNARDPFGLRTWPTNYPKVIAPFSENRGSGPHSGADIRNPLNEPVFTTDSGVVDNVWHSPRGGNQIRILNDDGSMSGYAHTKGEVQKGQRVTEGQRIGHSDGSGTGNAPHLHLTYRPTPGAPVPDPIPRLKPRGPKASPAAGGCRLQ